MTAREFDKRNTPAAGPTGHDALLASLRGALHAFAAELHDAPLQEMRDKGLAHHHVRIVGSRRDRAPAQAKPDGSGGAGQPRLPGGVLSACGGHRRGTDAVRPAAAGAALPRGGLLVQEIVGRAARLPDDLPAIARALARDP